MIPVLLLIPVIVSGFLLLVEMISGDMSRPRLGILAFWFLTAVYLQFRGGSPGLFAAGIIAQVVLAIGLQLRVTLGQGST